MSNKKTFDSNAPRSRVDASKTNPRRSKERPQQSVFNIDELDIPEDVREKFASQGWHLRWIRATLGIGGQLDSKNLGRRAKMGYIPVTLEEIGDDMALMVNVTDINLPAMRGRFNFKDVVAVGDLILAKCPIENIEAYRQEVYEESKLRHDNVSRNASENGVKINESMTQVTAMPRRFIQRQDVTFAQD